MLQISLTSFVITSNLIAAPQYCPPTRILGDRLEGVGPELKYVHFAVLKKLDHQAKFIPQVFFEFKAKQIQTYICSHQRLPFKIPCQLRNKKNLKVSALLARASKPHLPWFLLLFPRTSQMQPFHLNVVTIWCCLYISELANNSSSIHFFNINISTLFISVCIISYCCQILNILTVFLILLLGTFISHYKETLRYKMKLVTSFIK